MTQSDRHVAENKLSKQDCTVVAYHQATQCYFRPETEELLFLADCEAGEFENHWRGMMTRVNEFHLAKEVYSRALEQYGKTASTSMPSPLLTETHFKELTAAETRLDAEREALREKLGKFSLEKMGYDDVVELIPIAGKGAKSTQRSKSSRYVYVKKGYFSESEQGRKLHRVSLKGSEKNGAGKSIFVTDKHGRRRIDTQKLKEQLTTLEGPKLKADLKDLVKWAGLDFDPEALNEDKTLFDWAERWNKSLAGKTSLGEDVDVSAAAQFMRFVSNVGANVEFDPVTRNAAIQGEAKSSMTVASGMLDFTGFAPDRLGWSLSYSNAKGNVFDMGRMRLLLSSELAGFIGASVQLEAQLQIVTQGDQQMLAGQPDGRLPRFHERKTRGKTFHKQMAAEDEGLTIDGAGFAGARVERSLKGGLQWLKPTPPPDVDGRVAGLLKSTGEFTEICSIARSIGGLAGVAAGGKFHCTFINGKFYFHVAASLCWGVGAKGGLICEVGFNHIVEFGAWLIYQLNQLNYSYFDLMDKDSFKAYSQYCVMQMEDAGQRVYDGFVKLNDVVGVAREFKRIMSSMVDENKQNMDASGQRNKLAKNINSGTADLLTYTPEAKGILLYLLTRHGTWDHLDPFNYGKRLPDIYSDRKEAVIWVLRSIQTHVEWRKVFCCMTPDGSNLAESGNELEVTERQEQQLVKFLQEGFKRDQDLHRAKRELATIYDRIRPAAVLGYALAMNDSFFYQFNSLDNSLFPGRCTFGPCEADADRWV